MVHCLTEGYQVVNCLTESYHVVHTSQSDGGLPGGSLLTESYQVVHTSQSDGGLPGGSFLTELPGSSLTRRFGGTSARSRQS